MTRRPSPPDRSRPSVAVRRAREAQSPACRRFAWLLATCVGLASVLHAQMHKVEAPERVTRAIGVYEWTGDLTQPTAMRLIPVSLFIDGHFEDAGAYLARPVPWALDYGNEYLIEKAGQQEGTLDLESARNVLTTGAAADDASARVWYGYGRFKLPAPAPKPKALPAARVTPSIEGSDDDSRPHMSRRTPPPVPGGGAGSSAPGASGSGPSGSASGDADKPTLGRRNGSSADGPGGSPDSSASNDTYDPDRPTLRHRDDDSGKKNKRQKPQGYVTGPSDSLNDDPDRPTLRHTKAEDVAGPKELTGLPAQLHQAVAVSDPANHPAHLFTRAWDSSSERAETLVALEAQARGRVAAYFAANQLTPGVAPPAAAPLPVAASPNLAAPAATAANSPTATTDDSAPPVLRTKASADAAKAAAARTAAAKVAAQNPGTKTAATNTAGTKAPATKTTATKPSGTQPAGTPATAPKPIHNPASPASPNTTATSVKPAPASHATTASARRTASRTRTVFKPPVLTLANEQLAGYELSYGGLPTFVYTAEAYTANGATVYVTVVAQKLPSGEFQVALASVTDSRHMDRTPWMRPVDVVDPDEEHRASLLFELRAQNTRQFALYRLTGPRAEQIFVTGIIP